MGSREGTRTREEKFDQLRKNDGRVPDCVSSVHAMSSETENSCSNVAKIEHSLQYGRLVPTVRENVNRVTSVQETEHGKS